MEQSYKEKYEQAIERLKQWDREHPCAGYVVSDRDKFIFPELAESENEKIRKQIVNAIHDYAKRLEEKIPTEWLAWLEKQGQVKESAISQHEIETCKENGNSLTSEDEKVRKALLELVHDTTGDELWIDYNVHKEETLDWLERQGEHANFRNKIQVGDKVTRNEDGVLVNLSQLKRVAKPREKQGEKHPDPYNGISFEYNGHIWGMCARDNGVDISCDKHLIKHLEKQGEQKPAEWSEEDEVFLDDILCKLEHDLILNKDEKDWLKSLRPQSQWKPSSEQIGLLQAIINEPNNAASESCQIVLREVLEQLKKLKEE